MLLFTAAPARRLLLSCSAAAALLLGGAGCHSARSAYQFQPAPAVAAAPRPSVAAPPQLAATPGPVAAAPVSPFRPGVIQPAKRLIRRVSGKPRLQPIHQLASAGQTAYAAAVRPARRNAGATDGAQATAEVGLGTTVLGVLGLIVGPISLIGLLIWGGPVWAVLLGLSALAVLIAYIDPFR